VKKVHNRGPWEEKEKDGPGHHLGEKIAENGNSKKIKPTALVRIKKRRKRAGSAAQGLFYGRGGRQNVL